MNNNKRIRDPNHKQENGLKEASDTTRIRIDGDGINTTDGTGSILLDGVLAKSEYLRTVNNATHNNNDTVQVACVIDNGSNSDEVSNCNMEDLVFVVDDEDIPNFCEEEDDRNFMSKDCKWEYWEEVRYD